MTPSPNNTVPAVPVSATAQAPPPAYISDQNDPILLAQNKPPDLPSSGPPASTAQRWASAPDTLPPDDSDSNPEASVSQTGYRNPAALAKYKPTVANNAKMLADYTLPINSYQLARSPVWVQAAQAAHEYDPSFNAAQYDIRKNLNNSFASGKDSVLLQSVNRTVGHLGDLRDVANNLDNSSGYFGAPLVSKIENLAERASGDPRVGRFESYADAAAREMVQATRGVGGNESDVKAWRGNLNSADPKGLQLGNIETAINILSQIASAQREKYIKGMGRPPQQWQFLDPRSRQVLTEMGFDPDKIEQGVKAEDARLSAPGQKNLQTNTNKTPAQKTVSPALVHQYATEHQIDDATASKVFTDAKYRIGN